jgi:hypothetical protein
MYVSLRFTSVKGDLKVALCGLFFMENYKNFNKNPHVKIQQFSVLVSQQSVVYDF